VIELAAERFTKNLWSERHSAERPQLVSVRDETDQAGYIIKRVLENREVGTSLKQQAVLFRTSHHSGPLEVELTRRNTCWRCCALRKTRATAWPVFVLCTLYPAWGRHRLSACLT
jgi:superfamily I DNA/RNA helicase